ncbi:MAG: hypothetical protein R3C97_13580 [Geminicoccaceae bacterium]
MVPLFDIRLFDAFSCRHLGREEDALERFRKASLAPLHRTADGLADYLPIRRPDVLARWHEDFSYLQERA